MIAAPLRVVALLAVSGLAWAAPDEDELGKAKGYPVCPISFTAPFPQDCLVGTLSHFDQVVPARTVKAGSPRALKRSDKEPTLAVETFLEQNRNTGLLVMKGDTVLVERYQYDRKPSDRFQSYSMAKTVVAILVGIAIDEKKIRSVDDTAQQYVPELKGSAYGGTKLRHLLTMSSGVRFIEEYNGRDDITVLARKTLGQEGPGGVQAVLAYNERDHAPGTRFYYASAETEVLSLVLKNATGKPLADYLSEKIWQPMGAEADATWLIDGGGHELGFMGLNATLRDWGRLGAMLANNGAVDGRQIVPAAWLKAMTTPDAPHLKRGMATKFNGYGYQTWLIGNTENAFALFGVRGQGVFIDPDTKLVIVHTAVHAQSRDPARNNQFELFFAARNAIKGL